jgi:DNA polymerase III epsilon subunit-like protein
MRHLVVDCETSGLSHEKNKVLTVGLVDAEIGKNKFKINDTDHIKVKHDDYNANPFALRINKIDLKEHHKTAIYPKFACKKINQFINKNSLSSCPVLGHNLKFDFRFLNALSAQGKARLSLSGNPIDTMAIWRNLKSSGHVPSYLKSSLKEVSGFFNIGYENAHDALGDCMITAKVYKKLLEFDF